MLNKDDLILVTGGTGLIGSNLTRRLKESGYNVISVGSKVDLRIEKNATELFDKYKPNVVFHLAAKVGGIFANSNYKADFYSDNILINTNVVNASKKYNVEYMFAMGTGCAYPKKLESNLLKESDFLDGEPEVTNDAYAYAKRGLLVHLKALNESIEFKFSYCLPANIYGPFDNFHPINSHVVPGLVRRFCDAKSNNIERVKIWGDGSAKRDFLYIDDCVDAMIKIAQKDYIGSINVSTGKLTSIRDLAEIIKVYSNFSGGIDYDEKQLTGQKQRIFDNSNVRKLGWNYKVGLEEGIQRTINWFQNNRNSINER